MLIRVSGGSAGIKEYLENGQKQGREFSRDELDQRVILDGDLDLTDTIIRSMDNDGERYLHITLSFREDEISPETLKEITSDFRQFAMAAYDADEINFYAEAHLPKIKSLVHARTGQELERKPHIHIVIPEQNLLSGHHANPLGKVDQQEKFLEAFQEHANNKYGLASPKDHRRIEFTSDSEMISRHKGDLFSGANGELKNALLTQILERKITRYEDFKTMLAEHGGARSRNAGKENEYQNIKLAGAGKGVNLKEFVFSREFIELDDAAKRKVLAGEIRHQYETAKERRPDSQQIAARLQEWRDVRSKEVKYINSGNRGFYQKYRNADPAERRSILAGREAGFYQKHREEMSYDRTDRADSRRLAADIADNLRAAGRNIESAGRADRDYDNARRKLADRSAGRAVAAAIQRYVTNKTEIADRPGRYTDRGTGGGSAGRGTVGHSHAGSSAGHQRLHDVRRRAAADRPGREADNVVSQLSAALKERGTQERAAQLSEFAKIRNNLDASRLLAHVSKTHGVIPEKYQVSKGKDGSDRIQCGSRNLNVSDFLTKELNLPFKEAAPILRECYAAQQGNQHMQARNAPKRELWEQFQAWKKGRAAERGRVWDRQRASERAKREDAQKQYRASKARIADNRRLAPADRKAQRSILQMQKALVDKERTEQNRTERDAIKAEYSRPAAELYRDFLTDRAIKGDEGALAELRRMRTEPEKEDKKADRIAGSSRQSGTANRVPILPVTYSVARNGDVTYKVNGHDVIQDTAREVKMLQKGPDVMETGLRLAMAKYGQRLELKGTEEFKRQAALVAAEKGLRIEFTDPSLNKVMQDRTAEIAAERAKQERQYTERSRLAELGRKFIDQQRKKQTEPITKEASAEKQPSIEQPAPDRAAKQEYKHNATAAVDKAKYRGEVIEVDGKHVYQKVGHKVVAHDRAKFQKEDLPRVGDKVRIATSKNGKAIVRDLDQGQENIR